MTTIEDVIDETTGRSRAVLEYSRTMKTLVTRAKEPDFTVESWAPLAELIDTENFVRIGPFKEVMNWAEYAEFLTNWARSSSWDCSYQRLTEAAELVLLELEEFSEIGDFRSVVNTASVYEFSTENKIRYIAVYLQMQLPDPAMMPSFGTAEDTP